MIRHSEWKQTVLGQECELLNAPVFKTTETKFEEVVEQVVIRLRIRYFGQGTRSRHLWNTFWLPLLAHRLGGIRHMSGIDVS